MTHYTIKSITGARGQLIFRGFPFGYFDRSGHIPVWNVINTMRDNFNCLYSHDYFDYAELTENKTMYAARVSCLATKEFYTKAVMFNPISMECTTVPKHIGVSSVVHSATLTEEETGTPLVKSSCKFILMCNDTKKPVPLPDRVVRKYSKYISDQATVQLGKEPHMIVPRQVFSHKLQTRHNDLDSNGHVGTQEYFRFCMECAINASISGFYHHFVSNISLFPILKADITFRGQSVERKELNILTWQCEHNPAKMYFVIMRDNVRITECSFIFWENKIASVLSKS